MPNTFTDNRDRWFQLSDVDYLGQFVKAWLAFNAWYRNAYSETHDRNIIEEIKWNTNPIASRLRPLLRQKSEEAERFRTDIGLLHHRLARYELHSGKGQEKVCITLNRIVIRSEPPIVEKDTFYRWSCKVERVKNGDVTVVVTKPDGMRKVNVAAHKFDLSHLETNADFGDIPDSIKARFRVCYSKVNPRIERDLTIGNADLIACGTYSFGCGEDFLFAGVVEALYQMRCALFHGELVPTRDASECYEPAYRIVRQMLEAVG
ncbi:MAG TPA: hypothetical protein ENI60_01320 [Candidatus Fraserbacteria bacterium]|nr:hypothetical protein [Candidatus Fraserbacteria bacterium]